MQLLSGLIQCSLRTNFTNVATTSSGTATTTYTDSQTLQWSWTNSPALTITTGPQTFAASFSSRGSGSKNFHSVATSSTGQTHTQDGIDTWMTNCMATVSLMIRQTPWGTMLTSQESSPPNGVILTQALFLDNVQQGPTKVTSGPGLALAVSINFGPSIEEVFNRPGPLQVAPPVAPTNLLGIHSSRPGSSIIRNSGQDTFTPPKGPDAPLPGYSTRASWTWTITTQ